jgi:hypothetical protein
MSKDLFLFTGSGEQLMYDYLMILYQVVDESTVCLMGHERRQTLALIEDLRYGGMPTSAGFVRQKRGRRCNTLLITKEAFFVERTRY